VVRTDHYALKFLLDQRLSTIPRHAWVSKLFGYDFSVEYLLGKANTVVDALSRHDEDSAMALALSSPTFALFDDLRREMTKLEYDICLLEMIHKGEVVDKWYVVNVLAIYFGRIYVPTTSSLWPAILATAHRAGHEGIQDPASTTRFVLQHQCRQARQGVCQELHTNPSTSTRQGYCSPQAA
jgi:hypothetical protein